MENIELMEIVELFLIKTIHELKEEIEAPNLNFHFDEDGLRLFKHVVYDPFEKEGCWTPNAKKSDIKFLIDRSNDDALTIKIENSLQFFKYLMNITNSLKVLYKENNNDIDSRNIAISLMRYIWLRMGIEDVENIDMFLEKQLQFVNNKTFDYKEEKVNRFFDYDVTRKTVVNKTYDETTRSMVFIIKNNEEEYLLPYVLYDIDDNNNCYIYGIQNKDGNKSKAIERKLYKLNKGIENPDVHPSKVYALILFMDELKKKGITNIIVPCMQVLSYRYHEILSRNVENSFKALESAIKEYPNFNDYKNVYSEVKSWYDKVHDKEDKISYLKTEELINLIYRLTEHRDDIKIINEVNIDSDSINLRLGKRK